MLCMLCQRFFVSHVELLNFKTALVEKLSLLREFLYLIFFSYSYSKQVLETF